MAGKTSLPLVLVTGGSGMLGHAIKDVCDTSQYRWKFISSSDCDLTDKSETNTLFEKLRPTYVIHLAANVGGLFKNMNNQALMFEKNILINTHVLSCCQRFDVKKTVCCLSTCVYPDKVTYPIHERTLHNGPPHDSNFGYAYAKRMLQVHARAINQEMGDNRVVCVIPTNIYGEHDNFSLENAHVIPALIHKCYIAKQTNTPFEICGTGTPLRQFIYSKDLAKLVLWCMESYNSCDPINLTPSERDEVSISDVALEIAKAFDYQHSIMFNDTYSDGQYRKPASDAHLTKSLPSNFTFTPLHTGIQNTIEWFVKHYDTVRK